jgi:hypothetical protein
MNRRSSTAAFVVRPKKKSNIGNYQTWDQEKVFMRLEESPAHFLARVIEGGEEPLVAISSDALPGGYAEMRVKFRNTASQPSSGSKIALGGANRSAFRRHLSDVKTQSQPTAPYRFEKGEVVELQSCLLDEDMTTLYAYRHRSIASAERAGSILILPEIPAGLISSQQLHGGEGERLYSYSLAMAAKGEARQITDILQESTSLAENLEPGNDLVRGFLLRGRRKPGDKALTGVACLRTKRDDANKLSSREVLVNFMKQKSHLFLTSMSEDNPWEVITLYGCDPAKSIMDRVEALANRSPYLVSQDAMPSAMNFAHMNVVLDFKTADSRPKLVHVGLCRSKPLVLDTSIPDKARERNLKFKNAMELEHSA